MTTQRQGKPAALALLACMAAVAVMLWVWPSSSPRSNRPVRGDMVLAPASGTRVDVSARVSASPAAVQQATPDRPRGRADARPGGAPPLHASSSAAEAAPAGLILAPFQPSRGHSVEAAPPPIASRTVFLPMNPVVPAARRFEVPTDASSGNAFAHAGIAIGSAFRRAGVNTGAAFSRIF